MIDLLSIQGRVEIPFIYITLGGYTFGKYEKNGKLVASGFKTVVNYPNLVKSLRVTRNASGTVNIYNLDLVYAITEKDDPNMLEKIFSKASKDRKILISYGDYTHPTYMYREEQAIIQKITPNFSFSNSTINYTITAVSSVLTKAAISYSFKKYTNKKPSDVIKEILYSTQYKFTDIFTGMVNKERVVTDGLIASDDRATTIDAQTTTLMKYLQYLVNCMVSVNDSASSTLRKAVYRLAFFDDISGSYNGPYFKVVKQETNSLNKGSNLINFDLGYTGESCVIDFNANVSEMWSILYNYNEELEQSQVQYIMDDNGVVTPKYTNRLIQDTETLSVSESEKAWLSQMTSFPITATMKIKGLIKPAILTTNIKVNILFYGKPYILSGIYMVTGQEDTIDANGFRTTLSLVRVGGETW